MRRLPPAGQHRRDPALLTRPLARRAGGERGADLEQPDVGHAVGPVGLHQPHQAGEQPAAEPGLVGRERIEQAHAAVTVGGTHRQAHYLVEPLGHEAAAHRGGRRLLGRVGQGADAERAQIGREVVIAVEPGDLLDEVDLAPQVGPPAGYVYCDPAVLGFAHRGRADRNQVPLELGPRQLDAQHLRHSRRPEEDARRVRRHGPEVHRRLVQGAARGREDQLDAAAHGRLATPAVDPALEPVARLGAQVEVAPRPAGAGRVPHGGLEQDIAALDAHLRVGPAHHPREADDPFAVGDRHHFRRERALDVVEGHQPLAGPRPPDHQGPAPEPGQVVRVHRLVQLEHDVVGGIHHVVDGAHPYRFQPAAKPLGRRADGSPANHGRVEAGAGFRILDGHPEAACDVRRAGMARRWDVQPLRAGNLREPERRP